MVNQDNNWFRLRFCLKIYQTAEPPQPYQPPCPLLSPPPTFMPKFGYTEFLSPPYECNSKFSDIYLQKLTSVKKMSSASLQKLCCLTLSDN